MSRRAAATSARPSFQELGFASQMIVWAVRKRLHTMHHGDDDAHVAKALRLGGLAEAHELLASVVDVLVCAVTTRIEMHSVACPCLAPHEIALLGAFAALQQGGCELARARLGALLSGPAVDLVLPALCAIVNELDAKGLRLTPVDADVASAPPDAVIH